MARINKSQYAILGVLSMKSMSAYGIKMFMQRTTQHFWSESEAQIYPTIKKLHEQALLSAHEEKAAKAGTKKIYTLTKAGKKVLQDWLKQKVASATYRNEHLLKVFFGANQSVEANIDLLKQWLDETQLAQVIIKDSKQQLEEKKLPAKNTCYPNLTLDYGIVMLEAEARWCKKSIETLQKLKEQ